MLFNMIIMLITILLYKNICNLLTFKYLLTNIFFDITAVVRMYSLSYTQNVDCNKITSVFQYKISLT